MRIFIKSLMTMMVTTFGKRKSNQGVLLDPLQQPETQDVIIDVIDLATVII